MDRVAYIAALRKLNAKPAGKDLPTQKFKRGSRIHVTPSMPKSMAHFQCDFDGIVRYTYAQKFGGDNVDSYSLIVLNDSGQPVYTTSWYHEDQLTLVNDDIAAGLAIIESYRCGGSL